MPIDRDELIEAMNTLRPAWEERHRLTLADRHPDEWEIISEAYPLLEKAYEHMIRYEVIFNGYWKDAVDQVRLIEKRRDEQQER